MRNGMRTGTKRTKGAGTSTGFFRLPGGRSIALQPIQAQVTMQISQGTHILDRGMAIGVESFLRSLSLDSSVVPQNPLSDYARTLSRAPSGQRNKRGGSLERVITRCLDQALTAKTCTPSRLLDIAGHWLARGWVSRESALVREGLRLANGNPDVGFSTPLFHHPDLTAQDINDPEGLIDEAMDPLAKSNLLSVLVLKGERGSVPLHLERLAEHDHVRADMVLATLVRDSPNILDHNLMARMLASRAPSLRNAAIWTIGEVSALSDPAVQGS